MTSRLFGPTTGFAVSALLVSFMVTSIAYADGPEYSYIGISYEWTDVKNGMNAKIDENFNNGDFEGENIELSIGILDWLHATGEAFGYLDGTCSDCNINPDGTFYDADIESIKAGLGINLGLDMIGLSENADFVLRGSYIWAEISDLNLLSPSDVSDDGYAIEAMIWGRISDRADVFVGYEYERMDEVRNRNATIGLNYVMFGNISAFTRGIIFDSETGFELGLRWQFGGLFGGSLFGGN